MGWWVDSVADVCTFGSDCSDCGLRSDSLVAPEPDGVGYPDPDDPLLQKLDESVVASSLMKAFEAMIPERDEVNLRVTHLYAVRMLQASEVNPINGQFIVPYARRYVRHSWTLNMLNDHEMIEAYPNEPKLS